MRDERLFSVECYGHGYMVRDHIRAVWECPSKPVCGMSITDEEIWRLYRASPEGTPNPVPIVVT